MKKNITFESLRKDGLLIYEYVRGSHLYGLNTETSDVDTGGVYIEPLDHCLGLGITYPEVVNDETNDTTWNSLRKYFALLLNSNPNILESLYVPEDKIIYKHPVMDIILENRDKFLTKKSFGSFCGYARTQLVKCKSLKTRITNPVFEKLSPLEFVYYPWKQGSRKIKLWLEENGLMQEHCGLTKVPHMDCTYNVYYDWGAHWRDLGIDSLDAMIDWLNTDDGGTPYPDTSYKTFRELFIKRGSDGSIENLRKLWDRYKTPFKYHGIISRNGDSEEIRYSSVPERDELPLIQISYNKDEYSRHCQQYREYVIWDKHHNEERFSLATKAMYDRKNACHAARLMQMGIEIARGEGLKIDRSGIDRDMLMSIRRGEWTYEDILKYLESKDQEMKDAMSGSTLPDEIDCEWLDEIMIKIRRNFYEGMSNKSI